MELTLKEFLIIFVDSGMCLIASVTFKDENEGLLLCFLGFSIHLFYLQNEHIFFQMNEIKRSTDDILEKTWWTSVLLYCMSPEKPFDCKVCPTT